MSKQVTKANISSLRWETHIVVGLALMFGGFMINKIAKGGIDLNAALVNLSTKIRQQWLTRTWCIKDLETRGNPKVKGYVLHVVICGFIIACLYLMSISLASFVKMGDADSVGFMQIVKIFWRYAPIS